MRRRVLWAGLAVVAAVTAAPAQAGSAARGAELFEAYCGECHTANPGGLSRKGPNLFGIVGRKTGSVAGFDYSEANRAANWIWSGEILDRYLVAPKTAIPGTVMKFKGIPDPVERADVVTYLLSLK